MTAQEIIAFQNEFVKTNNPNNLPIVRINNSWVEGSDAKYYIEGYFNSIKNYQTFIKTCKKMYTGLQICLVANTDILCDYSLTITIGTIN